MATPLGKLAFAWTIAMVDKFFYFRYFPCDSNNETSEGLLSGRRITKEESRRKVAAVMRFLADSIRASHLGLDSLAKNIEDQYRSYHIRIDEAEATRWVRPSAAGGRAKKLKTTYPVYDIPMISTEA